MGFGQGPHRARSNCIGDSIHCVIQVIGQEVEEVNSTVFLDSWQGVAVVEGYVKFIVRLYYYTNLRSI